MSITMTFLQKRKLKYYGLIFLVIGAITTSTLGFLKYYDDTNRDYVVQLGELHKIELSALYVQYYFKRQVQEWKNTLLRGADPQDYQKYNELFSEEFLKTQAAAEILHNLITDDSPAKPIARAFMTKHKEILADYLSALEVFKDTGFDPKAADRTVRGLDRQPTDMLYEINSIINQEVTTKRTTLKKELDWIRWSTGACFVSLQVLLCWIVVSLTNKLLKANISDKYTGIGNRELFIQSVNDALHSSTKASISIIDLDNFKLINEAFGNRGGDRYLKEIAKKLQTRLRSGDLICRVSGDVLGLISYHADEIETESFVKELLALISRYEHKNNAISVSLTACAGIFCMHRATETDVEQLLNKVYASLQEAKELGPGSLVTFYDDNKHIAFRQQQMRKVTEITNALKDSRITLYKQQIRPLEQDAHYTYHEVLLRVVDVNGNVQGPGLFLQSAERFHLMDKIDRYVLRALVEYMVRFPDDHSYYTVNLSGNTLSDIRFIEFVDSLFAAHVIKHSRIGFEITETNIIKNFDTASAVLRKLASYQCKISLDDFGTGMSSYSYISELAINTLKIDGTFIQGIDRNLNNQAILRSVVQLAKDLGISTVAEFIETQEELDTVKKLKVDYIQGYFLHKPEFMYQPEIYPKTNN